MKLSLKEKKHSRRVVIPAIFLKKDLIKYSKKVGEESTEMVIAAKNGVKDETVGEICDLIYHTLVMMANEGITPDDVDEELRKRAEKAANLKKFHVVDKNS